MINSYEYANASQNIVGEGGVLVQLLRDNIMVDPTQWASKTDITLGGGETVFHGTTTGVLGQVMDPGVLVNGKTYRLIITHTGVSGENLFVSSGGFGSESINLGFSGVDKVANILCTDATLQFRIVGYLTWEGTVTKLELYRMD